MMKTKHQKRKAESEKRKGNTRAETLRTPRSALRAGFTLIELLTVIAIIGVIAAMIFAISGPAKRYQYLKTSRGEMAGIELALDNYKAKYGVYPPGNGRAAAYAVGVNSMYNPLYYELSGVTNEMIGGVNCYQTLDGSAAIPVASVSTAFGVGGFINCSKTGDEEGGRAENFLLGLRANRIAPVNIDNSGLWVSNLVTSVRGPDATYQPLGVPDVNPFRYVYPGTNNPNSYDLWIQLKIGGKTNLLCNWNKQIIVNSPLP